MDAKYFQGYFVALDSLQVEELCDVYLHKDLRVFIIGVEGVVSPLDRAQFLDLVQTGHSDSHSVIHIPGIVKSEGNLAFVDGYIKTSFVDQPDLYGKFTDFFKFSDGEIMEYNICNYSL